MWTYYQARGKTKSVKGKVPPQVLTQKPEISQHVSFQRQGAVGMYSKSISNFLPGKMVPRLVSYRRIQASKIGDITGQKMNGVRIS